ncbi:hypothetical protein [Dapis sp. BLCC M229]|uniref:hypothetical protein n=1 Tax=Dapis sp. BLCC M229 TaxID=3400188 RepID=UPI003CF8AAB0
MNYLFVKSAVVVVSQEANRSSILDNGLVLIVARFVWRDANAAVNILEVVQPKTKVETPVENSVQLSFLNVVAVRVASRREGSTVDYL